MRPLSDQSTTNIPDTITFECELSAAGLDVEWYKADRQIRKSEKYSISISGAVHKLVINDTDDRDVGEYSVECKKVKSTATLTIHAPPKLLVDKSFKESLTVHANKSVIIEVPFSGSPQPAVTWQYNNGRIPDPTRISWESIYGMTALTLSRARRADTGSYSLTLSNDHGKATLAVKVKVVDKPGRPRDLAIKDVNSTWAALRWAEPEDDGDAPITGYIVERREGYRRMWQNVATTTHTEFTVENLIQGNQYAFRVTAQNHVGSGEPIESSSVVTAQSKFCEYIDHLLYLCPARC